MSRSRAGEGGVDRARTLVAGAQAAIFDLDGVLVDTEPWWHAVRVAWASERGHAWTDADSRACMGRNSGEWARIMAARLGLDEPPQVIERAIVDALVARYEIEPVPAVRGATAAARAIAARVPVAIASSAHPEVIRAALGAAGLADVFETVVSSDDVAAGKPAPDVYVEAARRLGVEPPACLVFEDSWNGVLAARAAGMRVVLVPNASVPPGDGAAEVADLVIRRLDDLPLDELGAAA
jgi:beta-phosphoglucomutase-like phosphatase (HAD superfamily)